VTRGDPKEEQEGLRTTPSEGRRREALADWRSRPGGGPVPGSEPGSALHWMRC